MDLKEEAKENLWANLDVAGVRPRGTGEGAEVLSQDGWSFQRTPSSFAEI